MAQKKYKDVAYIQMDISYYGKYFSKVKYYPAKVSGVSSHSLRDEDGFWLGLDLDGVIPINVHLFFSIGSGTQIVSIVNVMPMAVGVMYLILQNYVKTSELNIHIDYEYREYTSNWRCLGQWSGNDC